jgi:putative MFS transporter
MIPKNTSAAWMAVFVAALGYFVDVFDMWLFSIYRVQSLTDMGYSGEELTNLGVTLINWQQAGFLIGGFFWGVLGDKFGRSSVMFGSIAVYSLATFLNSFVTEISQYEILRLLAGFGLAGEIGAGITLVAELLPQKSRGWGTTIVTGLGVSGAAAAAYAGKIMHWKDAYVLGGVMGFMLLILRVLVHESGLYSKTKNVSGLERGSLRLLFSEKERIFKFISCILIGVPIYLTFGIFVTFSPEIIKAFGINEAVVVADTMLYASIALTIGDLLAGVFSQLLKSRKKPLFIFIAIAGIASIVLALGNFSSVFTYSVLVGITGLFTGYWACMITLTTEQFGTNLRATVTTIVPNLVRASTILLSTFFGLYKGFWGIPLTILVMTVAVYGLSFISLFNLKETFHRDLDFHEHRKKKV